MLNLASELVKSNNSSSGTASTNENNQFPTVGLKSLLQNSDLLELLLKPLETTTTVAGEQKPQLQLTSTEDSKKSPTHSLTEANLKYNSLFDIDILDECLESKESKIENDDASSKYGNAFFGQSLWEKSEIYQSDKTGVKFEYLDVDDFLNENGLNEADVEFLEQLQKYDSSDAGNKSTQGNLAQQSNQNQKSSSPFASSPSSHSSASSAHNSLKNLLDSSPITSNEEVQSNKSDSLNMQIRQGISKSKDTFNRNVHLNANTNQVKKMEKNIGDWKSNDLSIDSVSDYRSEDDFDDEFNDSKKMTEEELKLQPLMKKSKKNSLENMMMTSNKKSFNNSNNNSSFDFSLVSITEFDIENDLLNSDSDESDLDDDLDKSISKKVSKKSRKKFVPDELKDDKYWARRRKNNVAAKRSRDARRMKENQIAVRATYLERENDLLRKQLEDFKRENKVLKIKLSRYETSSNLETIAGK